MGIEQSAEDVFHQLFEMVYTEPVTVVARQSEEARILFPAKYRLSEETFFALSAAVAALFDEHECYVYLLERHEDSNNVDLVELGIASEYERLPDYLANCMLSISGSWGVYLSGESYGILVGSRVVLDAVESGLARSYRSQERAFLRAARTVFSDPDSSVPPPWLMAVISSVHGEPQEARAALLAAGFQAES